jgi:hypothetical protein
MLAMSAAAYAARRFATVYGAGAAVMSEPIVLAESAAELGIAEVIVVYIRIHRQGRGREGGADETIAKRYAAPGSVY